MKKLASLLLLLTLFSSPAFATLKAVSNSGSNGLPSPVINGDCVVGSGGVAIWGSCAGTSSVNLGTSTSAVTPLVTGDATTGFYTAGANKVDVAVNGTKTFEWGTLGATNTGTLSTTGDFAVNTNKFTVTASSGNAVVAGTLGVTGVTNLTTDLNVNTNKFNVTGSNGNTAIAGTLGVTSDFSVNTNKFNVTASNGNTTVAGTAVITGAVNMVSSLVVGSASAATSGAALDLGNNTNSILLPIGTTGQRPGSGVNGMMRYNSTLTAFEGFANGAWGSLGSGAGGGVTSVATTCGVSGGTITTTGTISGAGVIIALTDADGTSIASTTSYAPVNTLSAARSYQLPSASAYGNGCRLRVTDINRSVSGSNTVTFTRAGSDTIDNATTYPAISLAGFSLVFVSDGTSNWTTEAVSTLSDLSSAQVWVGNSSNTAQARAITGAVTIGNSGITDIGTNKVTVTMLAQAAGGTLLGNNTGSLANVAATTAPVLGISGASTGSITFAGGTGGSLKLTAPASAGTGSVLTFPGATFDFSGSGGTHQVVQQATSGGAFSVGQLAFTDISGTLTVGAGGTGLTTGTIGGVPFFSGNTTLTSSGALTANLPVIGGGASGPSVGTVTGNTTKFATWVGATTSGRCVDTDSAGNLQITTGDCNTGTSGGTPATGNTTAVTVTANTASDQLLQELHPADAAFNTQNMELSLHESGIYSTAAASTVSIKAKLCTQTGGGGTCVTLGTITSGATTAASNQQFFFDMRCGVKTTGASGNLICHGLGSLDLTSGVLATSYTDNSTAVSSNYDLTGPNFIIYTVAFASASGSNSMTAQNAYVSPYGMGGTVTQVSGTSPISVSNGTTTPAVSCPTCVTSASSLTSGGVVTGAGSQAAQTNADMTFATGTLSLGVNTSEAGAVKLFGSTSGNLTVKAAAAAGSNTTLTLPGGTTDFSSTGGTGQYVKQASAGAAFTVGTIAAADVPSIAKVSTYCTAGSGLTCTGNSGATFTKSTTANVLVAVVCGGGGGGGGGQATATGTPNSGGSAGGGGACQYMTFKESDVQSSFTVTLGSGGGGGAAATNGTVGSNSTAAVTSTVTMTGYGGGPGNSGASNASVNGAQGGDLFGAGIAGNGHMNGYGGGGIGSPTNCSDFNSNTTADAINPYAGGGSSGSVNGSIGANTPTCNSVFGGPPGGSGGGVATNSGGTVRAGNSGGKSMGCFTAVSGGSGAGAGGQSGGTATNPFYVYLPGCGGGGGAGSNSNNTSGGAGTAGTQSAGGGGGGSTYTGGTGVAGGGAAGGDGYAYFIEY